MEEVFLKNAWYVGLWAEHLHADMVEQIILDISIVFLRDKHGRPHAMENTCPHRFAPLHKGKFNGDYIACPYHGLVFNLQGKCVENPNGSKLIPAKAEVQVFPVVERHDMIWVWMGDPALADAKKIPDFSCHTSPDLPTVKGVLEIDAYYELITDNLMDLTHAVTVHDGILGSEAIARGKNTVVRKGTTVWSNTWCKDGMAPPAWDHVFGNYGKPVDHWLNMRWDAPGHMLLDVGVTPVGKPRSKGVWVYGTDILTPISSGKTRYFWAISRSHDIDDPKFDDIWTHAIETAFEGQDKPMIEAQQRMIQLRGGLDIDEFDHVFLGTDAGPVRARQTLRKIIKNSAEANSLDPQNESLKKLIQKSETCLSVEPVV